MNNLLKITLLSTLLLLQGCVTYWANPGGRNWDADLSTCKAQSVSNVCRTTNQVSNSVCKTYPNGEMRCQEVTTPSQTICGPQENRQLTEVCLKKIGWRETDKQGAEASVRSNINPTDRERFNQLRAERDALCSNPKYAMIIAKSPCSSDNLTSQQLSDSSKITPQQKALVLEFQAEAKKSSPEMKLLISRQTRDPDAANQRLRYLDSVVEPAYDENRQRLLDGKITWGQYNTRGREITLAARAWKPTP